MLNRREFLGGLATLPFVVVPSVLPSLMSIIEMPCPTELRAIAWTYGNRMDSFLLELPTKHKNFDFGHQFIGGILTITLWTKDHRIGTMAKRLQPIAGMWRDYDKGPLVPKDFEIIYTGI